MLGRFAGVAVIVVVGLGCKKDSSSGLPPGKEWKPEGSTTPAPAPPPAPAATPAPPPSPHGGSVPQATAERTLEKLPEGRLGLGPFSLAAPADWSEKPITSSMRAGHFVLPAAAGAEAELVVYYFGEGGAGGTDANLDRWLGQFQQPDGKPSRDVAKIEKTTIAGQDATVVSVGGRYVATAMPGTAAVDKTDQALLAAIVASPKGPYYFKLVGAKATVDAQAAKFRELLASMKLR